MQNGAADTENRMEILSNIKNRNIIWPRYPISGYFPKGKSQRDISIPMFTTALFTMTKMWKHPKCSLMDEWIKKMYLYTYSEILLGLKKEGNSTTCDNMDESWGTLCQVK